MVVGIIQIDVGGQLAQVLSAVDVVSFKNLFEPAEAAESRGVFRQWGVRDVGIVFGKKVVAVIADDLFHGNVDVVSNTGGIGTSVFVDFSEFVSVAEIDERHV